MKRDQYDYFFKFVLIGDTCTGKSCLLVRFAVSRLSKIRSNDPGSLFHRIFIICMAYLFYQYHIGRRVPRELRDYDWSGLSI